jgi:uncharacterized delta-60 repeat protein
MKSRIIGNLLVALIVIAFFACSKKDEPAPDKEPGGTIDPGTGTGNGTTNLVDYDAAYQPFEGKSGSAAMLADGSVVLLGTTKSTSSFVFKVTKDGVYDASINVDQDKSWLRKKAGSLAVLPDGKIILGGEFQINGKTYSVIRLTSTGALDNSFTPYNVQFNGMNDGNISKIFVQKDGKMIIVCTGTVPNIAKASFIIRLNANGSLDNSFFGFSNFLYSASNNSTIISTPTINDIIQQSDGKIVICGGLSYFSNKRRYIVRINTDGSLDETFKFKERIDMLGSPFGEALCLAEQNGKILVGGYFDALVTEELRDTKFSSLNLLRLNSDGSIDQSFKASSEKNAIISLIVRNDNSFVALSNHKFNSTQIALYNSDGSIRGGYKIAEDKSVLVNMLKQVDDKILVSGTIIGNNGQTSALVRLSIK